MAILKKGFGIGRQDMFGESLHVGDHIKELGTGLIRVINKYGGLDDEKGQPIYKKNEWKGRDFELNAPVEIQTEADEAEQKAVEAVNDLRAEEDAEKDLHDKIECLNAYVSELKKTLEKKDEEIEGLKDRLMGKDISDDDLVTLLRSRHYTGTIMRPVTTMMETTL